MERSFESKKSQANAQHTSTALLLLAALSVACMSSCSGDFALNLGRQHYIYQVPEQTDDGLETASLDQAGMDPALIAEAIDRVKKGKYEEVHSILIVKDGKLVLEEYFRGHRFKYDGKNQHGELVDFDRGTIHNLASVTKSFTSALVGIAVDQGFIKDVNDKVFSYFPEYSHLNDPNKDKVTIEHLLTMTSGLQWNEWEYPYTDTRNDLIQLFVVSDPIEYILSKPVVHEPGTKWYYSGGDVNLLSEIIRRASGFKMNDFAALYMFRHMGITEYEWQFINPSLVYASGDLKLRPRDMARFGLLYLRGGLWDGKQIISAEWIEKSTGKYIGLGPGSHKNSHDYGYQWFLKTYHSASREYESYLRSGWGGQMIVGFPELDMLVVFTGGNYASPDPTDEIIARYILPSITNSQ